MFRRSGVIGAAVRCVALASLVLVAVFSRGTLIAKRGKSGVYRFDLRLQGEDETVFFEV